MSPRRIRRGTHPPSISRSSNSAEPFKVQVISGCAVPGTRNRSPTRGKQYRRVKSPGHFSVALSANTSPPMYLGKTSAVVRSGAFIEMGRDFSFRDAKQSIDIGIGLLQQRERTS